MNTRAYALFWWHRDLVQVRNAFPCDCGCSFAAAVVSPVCEQAIIGFDTEYAY